MFWTLFGRCYWLVLVVEDGGGVSVTCCLRCCRQVDNCREADSWITWQLCHDMCHRDTSRVTRPLVTTDKWGGCVTSHNVLQVLTSRLLSRVGCLCLGQTKTNCKSLTMLQHSVQCTCCLHTSAGPRDRCQHCHDDTWHAEMSLSLAGRQHDSNHRRSFTFQS